jgi:hypothetical protein
MAHQSIRLERFPEGEGYTGWFGAVYIGDFLLDVDGYYKYWVPKDTSGYWTEHMLQLIVNKLKEINAAWDKQVNDYFENAERKSQGSSPSEDDTGLDPLSPFPPNNR